MARHRPDPRSQGVRHRLLAQVLVLQVAAQTYCLAAIDSLGLTVPLAEAVRQQMAAALGTEPAHVMLNFSHTHSAPEPTENGL